ncbi:hypothetical protein CALCODRAFT_517473 [Calocera cornea HHB12733]|uniref:Uncharacterized protein n=1 Tax=Calocera cornea HHB12733 TaxID=1353952 RepID=A0A165FYP8_9BASI|nr:hypothetical protein CALCODRAFT_517473 [Calocera cornea HHB12733]
MPPTRIPCRFRLSEPYCSPEEFIVPLVAPDDIAAQPFSLAEALSISPLDPFSNQLNALSIPNLWVTPTYSMSMDDNDAVSTVILDQELDKLLGGLFQTALITGANEENSQGLPNSSVNAEDSLADLEDSSSLGSPLEFSSVACSGLVHPGPSPSPNLPPRPGSIGFLFLVDDQVIFYNAAETLSCPEERDDPSVGLRGVTGVAPYAGEP